MRAGRIGEEVPRGTQRLGWSHAVGDDVLDVLGGNATLGELRPSGLGCTFRDLLLAVERLLFTLGL